MSRSAYSVACLFVVLCASGFVPGQNVPAAMDAPQSFELLLRYQHFDPLVAEPAIPADLTASFSSRLFIVQYHGQGLEEHREVVRALGGAVHRFLANHANVIEIDPAMVPILRAQPFVRWVGAFHPATSSRRKSSQ
jgi:hypothetical protein